MAHLLEPEEIDKMLREEVLKRDAIEGPDADSAARRVSRCADRSITKQAKPGTMESSPPAEPPAAAAADV